MINFFTKRFRRMKNKKGFTLVELIVVIVIIGILAAILIPRMTGFTDKAKSTEALVIAKEVATAYDSYLAEKEADGDWPIAAADVSAAETYVANLASMDVGDFTLEEDGGVSVTKNSKTAGRTSGGAIVKVN